MENLKNGSFGKLFDKWNFRKLNLRIGTLKNYFENEILKNLKIGTLENLKNWSFEIYLKMEVWKKLFEHWSFEN